MLNSGQSTISTPASIPRRYAARILASLPARSPTVGLICASATFNEAFPLLLPAAKRFLQRPALGQHHHAGRHTIPVEPSLRCFQRELDVARRRNNGVRI